VPALAPWLGHGLPGRELLVRRQFLEQQERHLVLRLREPARPMESPRRR